MKTSLIPPDLRLPGKVVAHILDVIVEELLPYEHRNGIVKVYREYWDGRSHDGHVKVYSVGVALVGKARYYNLFHVDDWSDTLPDGEPDGDVRMAGFGVSKWRGGAMNNQSYLYMKARLIEHRFNAFIRAYLEGK